MKKLSILLLILISIGCSPRQTEKNEEENEQRSVEIKTSDVWYMAGDDSLKGYLAFDALSTEKRPGIIVIHEWWGQNEYVQMRARQLAELGYIAFAPDLYGNGRVADNPKEASALSKKLYSKPELARERLTAALERLKEEELLNSNKLAAIGYCFGGTMALNMARMGFNLSGVVSFHGGLKSSPEYGNEKIKPAILVCHGEADQAVSDEEVKNFKKEMEYAGVDLTFITYSNATHAFTNTSATEIGKEFNLPIRYNHKADSASWEDMRLFLHKVFQ